MPENAILRRMLDRLYASLVRGPGLNCRPHRSRQRVDLTELTALGEADGRRVLIELLDIGQSSVAASVPMPVGYDEGRFGRKSKATGNGKAAGQAAAMQNSLGPGAGGAAPEEKTTDPAAAVWRRQKSLLNKLRNLGDDARTYEQDTGVNALALGYPILSVPPGALGGGSSRILAPIAFVPLALTVNSGARPGVTLACQGAGVDLVKPNASLMAWLERETNTVAEVAFEDEEGDRPWEEVAELMRVVAGMLALDVPAGTLEAMADPARLWLEGVPLADDLPSGPAVLPGAVLGLFPVSNQGLLRDTRQMLEVDRLTGPVRSFVEAGVSLEVKERDTLDLAEPRPEGERQPVDYADQRFVALADPCQGRTVELARTCPGLVIHGPPGTGKSQTITNIIGDHLARGQRVLFVCDKRTALDVVANRLEHLGLGGLVAVVHDPQRDQRDLYMAIRARLEALPDLKTDANAPAKVAKVDAEMSAMHAELTGVHDALMVGGGGGASDSLHELMGRWLGLVLEVQSGDTATEVAAPGGGAPELAVLNAHEKEVRVVLERGAGIGYAGNPWRGAASQEAGALDAYLTRPAPEMRRAVASCVEDARAADATADPAIPPFSLDRDLTEQASARLAAAEQLAWLGANAKPAVMSRVAGMAGDDLAGHAARLRDVEPYVAAAREAAGDAELEISARQHSPTTAAIARELHTLDVYLDVASRWYGFLHFGVKGEARAVLRPYGVQATPTNAQRLRTFLTGYRARLVLSEVYGWLTGDKHAPFTPGESVAAELEQYERAIALRLSVASDAVLDQRITAAMTDAATRTTLLHGLKASPARAEAVGQLEASLTAIHLFDPKWLVAVSAAVRGGKRAADTLTRLESRFDDLESVLRIRDGLAQLPEPLRSAARATLRSGTSPSMGWAVLQRDAVRGEITRRLAVNPALARLDAQRMDVLVDRFRELEGMKRDLVRDAILHRWVSLQQARLLSSTGTRLNGDGATLRTRLFTRGKRAMRLRQVIALGQRTTEATTADDTDVRSEISDSSGGTSGGQGDPLFDMCPIWMASPETVAQLFPREPVFDAVVFDEASQCRLEEALPVLTRAGRVVIAGDPKQLPPTRFFEAAVTTSDEGELETQEDMFEMQQGEVEDLLAAALNLEVHESYLDVHYRSRNADLIEFSNRQFYRDRLQAIPGHPRSRTRLPPLTLHRVEGVYEDRCNPAEAARVVEIVRDLLRRAEPPSIGIACFNLVQRDLISEALDEAGNDDSDFASRLATARERQGEGSFEGLFVKNLENVQGDERDHIIISTTYGPSPEGKFHRRFGPLNMPGGGRRLNVLVTRARHEVHLVTSIPREVYRSIDPVPKGATPGGGWLLFAYLRFAEELAEAYEENHRVLEQAEVEQRASVHLQPIEPVSAFAVALAQQLASERGRSSTVHWGNAGFCVDAAMHHPHRAEDVTIGLRCDFARFRNSPDPVEWELFSTGILRWQGWDLHRVWTPLYFRDPPRVLNAIAQREADLLAAEAQAEVSPRGA